LLGLGLLTPAVTLNTKLEIQLVVISLDDFNVAPIFEKLGFEREHTFKHLPLDGWLGHWIDIHVKIQQKRIL